MPKLWSPTIGEHREAVRGALLDAAGALVEEVGLAGVTMSRLAERSGVGRATVYKYFPDAAAVLEAWHERLVHAHLAELADARDRATSAAARLDAVLTAYARLVRSRHGGEPAAALHRSEHVARALGHLHAIVAETLAAAVDAGLVRDDVPVRELASFCVGALGAARVLRTDAEVARLVDLTRSALLSPGGPGRP